MKDKLAADLGLRYRLVLKSDPTVALVRAADVETLKTYASLPSMAGKELAIFDTELDIEVPKDKG